MKSPSEVPFAFRRSRASNVKPFTSPTSEHFRASSECKLITPSAAFATLRPPLPPL
ncbi:MAG: hypothetical protein ACTS4T_00715 [Candidatus Hodgkinia cicadicola]